jgi:hypothetical protein
MLGFRMPFFSYRSASGALRWTVHGSVLQGLIASNRQIGFRRRVVACIILATLAGGQRLGAPRLSRWALGEAKRNDLKTFLHDDPALSGSDKA